MTTLELSSENQKFGKKLEWKSFVFDNFSISKYFYDKIMIVLMNVNFKKYCIMKCVNMWKI